MTIVIIYYSVALKRTSRQLHERKKWDDAVEGAVVGGTIGSIFGPNDAVGGVFGDFLCDLLCSDGKTCKIIRASTVVVIFLLW